jgi:hypothetical protein
VNPILPRRIRPKDLISACLVLAVFLAGVVAMASLAGAAEPAVSAAEIPLYQFFDTPAGKMAFLPGDTPDAYRVVLAERFWSLTPLGQPSPTPVILTGLAKEVRDWATALVPAEGRSAEAKRLAAGYRTVAERATKGELATLVDVQAAQTAANREALGLSPDDPNAGKNSRWYPVILKLAQWLQAHPPADAKAMGPISLEIAQGLEAVP